jgi:hypothetical protein
LWLGETGENSNQWLGEGVELMQDNNIGWAWWTHKKVESISAPLSAYKSPGYQTLLDYWNGQGSEPTEEYAMNALMAQADQFLLENCLFRKDYIDALIRQPFNTTTIPFADNTVPGTVYATNYDMGQRLNAYNDVDYENTGGSAYNSGWSYRNDGVDIEPSIDLSSNGYNVGWIETGDWLNFTLDVTESGIYDIEISIAAQNAGGLILLSLDDQNITPAMDVPFTGGWQNWQYITANDIYIPSGIHTLKAQFFIGGFNLSSMEFVLITTDVEDEIDLPHTFNLAQNFPNPFNPSTTIKYEIPITSKVVLKVYDLLGSEVAVLVDEVKEAGYHKVNFDGTGLVSGIYIVRIQADNFIRSKKMILLK